jgi:Spy/CpxP family protein refolding chaperone
MRHSFLKSAGLAALTAGIVLAQGAVGSNSQPGAPNVQEGRRNLTGHLERMAQALNLTNTQKDQARVIFQQARQSAEPIRQELRLNREKLTAAAKADKSAGEIQKLAAEQGRLIGQLVAIRTEASAKFYQILTPEQRVKADQMHEEFKQRMRSRAHNPGL